MEQKIPIKCIVNNNLNKNIEFKEIECLYCKGIPYEPVLSMKDNNIYCKNCFYKKNMLDLNKDYNIQILYNKIGKEKMKYLNSLKYYCPLCLKNCLNNEIKAEYSYDALIRHLITCQNRSLFKATCPNNNCNNSINIKLKDIYNQESINKILLDNQMIEKEIENEKLKINYIKYQRYLNSNKKKENEEHKRNKSYKNKFLNKKRKLENKENKNTDNKKIKSVNRCKLIDNKHKKDDNLKNSHEISENKEINDNKSASLFDICPHYLGNYKNIFSCCKKLYGCEQCHYINEKHQIKYNGEDLCLFCNEIFIGDKCPLCLSEKIQKRK